MPSNRRQRGTQLVRHGHQEVPLQLVRLRQLAGHLAEAVREVGDLVARANLRNRDVVLSRCDLVGCTRESEDRARHAARQVEEQQPRDDEPAEAGEAHPPDEDEPAIAQLRLRLRHDERPERLPQHLDGLRDGEIGAVLARRHQLERRRALRRGVEPRLLGCQPAKTGDVAGEEPDADVVEAGAGGHLEPRHDETRRRRPLVHALDRLLGEELAELAGLPPEVGHGLALGVVLEEADRDRRGDDPRDDDAEEEEGG